MAEARRNPKRSCDPKGFFVASPSAVEESNHNRFRCRDGDHRTRGRGRDCVGRRIPHGRDYVGRRIPHAGRRSLHDDHRCATASDGVHYTALLQVEGGALGCVAGRVEVYRSQIRVGHSRHRIDRAVLKAS